MHFPYILVLSRGDDRYDWHSFQRGGQKERWPILRKRKILKKSNFDLFLGSAARARKWPNPNIQRDAGFRLGLSTLYGEFNDPNAAQEAAIRGYGCWDTKMDTIVESDQPCLYNHGDQAEAGCMQKQGFLRL